MTLHEGHLVLFLHAHLPYVRHPEDENFLEEDWLYEAITETYLPLLAIAERWHDERLPVRITMSLTPTLCEMLRDDLLVRRYVTRTQRLIDLAEAEVRRTKDDERYRFTAELYRDRFVEAFQRFEKRYSCDIVAAFAALQRAGVIEIVTSAATHAFLPCLTSVPSLIRAQIRTGVRSYLAHFDRPPPGIWLPECGFVPGLDRIVADEGLEFFFVDSHAVEHADPRPVFSTYAPIVCPSGTYAFPRDLESSAQVWSAEHGYPGDGRYREFYRDIGHDIAGDPSLAPFALPGDARRNVGIKYQRITSRSTPLGSKEPYHRGWALEAVEEHAEHFVASRSAQCARVADAIGRGAVIVTPYDAELFGHWWFEGPDFLDRVVRKSCTRRTGYRLSTPTDVMNGSPTFQVAMPGASSWGAFGYSDTWLNERNSWIWPAIHRASRTMAEIASARVDAQGIERRVLNQMARELVLASASDWPFIITMDTMVGYAKRRVHEHLARFDQLAASLSNGGLDEATLIQYEADDKIFPLIDYTHFADDRNSAVLS